MTRPEFLEAVRRNPFNRVILERLPSLVLPDCWLVSGGLFQTVWNTRTGQRPDLHIKDYDVFYFDRDTSWEAEDAAIKRVSELFADLGIAVELRNQARVHLWYQEKFGALYPPLTRSIDGIDRFLSHNTQVGIRASEGETEVYAPRGFDDIFNLIVRPNRMPNFLPDQYMEKALRWKEYWPELTILPA